MSTVLQILASPIAPNTLTPIQIPSDQELQIARFPFLKAWWRADVDFSIAAQWTDRKEGKKLIPSRTGKPAVQTIAAYNSKPSLRFGVGVNNGELWDNGGLIWPVGKSYTIVYVGRCGTVDGTIIGTGQALTSASSIRHQTTGAISVRHNNVALVSTAASFAPTAPHIGVVSYDYAEKDIVLRVNRGAAVVANTEVAQEVTSAELHVGAIGVQGGGQSVPLTNGDIAEILVFETPLHLSQNAEMLAAVESYLGGRYGIAAA